MTLKVFPLRGKCHISRYFSCLRRPRTISIRGLGITFVLLWKHQRPVAVAPSLSPGRSWNTLDSWSSFVFKQLSTKTAPGYVLRGIPGGWISQGCTTPTPRHDESLGCANPRAPALPASHSLPPYHLQAGAMNCVLGRSVAPSTPLVLNLEENLDCGLIKPLQRVTRQLSHRSRGVTVTRRTSPVTSCSSVVNV